MCARLIRRWHRLRRLHASCAATMKAVAAMHRDPAVAGGSLWMSIEVNNIVESLRRPDAYPWRLDAVDLIETHISWVFLAGDRVVKVKRPVHFPFVDHRSAAQRRHSCEEEVRL